jgi:hypothetical protein
MARCRSSFFLIVMALALLSAQGAHLGAQAGSRRAASPAALLAFPGFFQGQLVVVRGTLATRDDAVLIAPEVTRSIQLLFNGPSPADGPVELRATFWDVGRIPRDDPRVQSFGLNRLLPKNPEADWPRPGEIAALVVTDVVALKPDEAAPSLRTIALEPAKYVGQRVKITGQFRGRNLYGDLPQGPGVSQYDFVLRAADASMWVTGLRPRGKGFNLDVGARVDTGTWLEATGVVREAKGLAWIEAQQFALGKPALDSWKPEAAPPPVMGPDPQVIFSDPGDEEIDVALKAPIRIQFSRDMDAETFKGRILWSFTAPDAVTPGQSLEAAKEAPFKYDRAKRSLEIRIDGGDTARYKQVVLELADGIAATDGAKLKPWKLTFSFAGE